MEKIGSFKLIGKQMSKTGGLLDVNHKINETNDKSIHMEEEY